MKEWERAEQAVIDFDEHSLFETVDIGANIEVRKHDSLRRAGRATRKNDRGEAVRRGIKDHAAILFDGARGSKQRDKNRGNRFHDSAFASMILDENRVETLG